MSLKRRKSSHISTLGSQVATTISVALVLLILGVLATIDIATGRFASSVLGKISLVVRLDASSSDAQIQQLGSVLDAAKWASKVDFASADDVLSQEMEYNAEALALIEENPYSPEFEVNIAPDYVHPDSIASIAELIDSYDCVDEVLSQTEMIRALSAATSRLSVVLSLVAFVLLVISIVLIFNTVSIAVYGRRFVIRTMQLVGATGSFIRRPFIRSALVTGTVAAIIASAALVAGQLYVSSLDEAISVTVKWSDTVIISLVLLALGLVICGLSAFVATNKYLRASYDNLYS